jgi:hypothetical protein
MAGLWRVYIQERYFIRYVPSSLTTMKDASLPSIATANQRTTPSKTISGTLTLIPATFAVPFSSRPITLLHLITSATPEAAPRFNTPAHSACPQTLVLISSHNT